MTPPPLEREFKLRLTAATTIEQIEATLAAHGVAAVSGEPTVHTDVYLDDDAATLCRHGVGLRVRTGPHGKLVGCKTAGERHDGLFVRDELETAWLGPGNPLHASDLPPALRDAVEPFVLQRQLAPTVVLQVQRLHRQLPQGSGLLGELVFDTVRAESGAQRCEFAEIELEVQDDVDAGRRIVDLLLAELPLSAATDDKLEYALATLGRLPRIAPLAADASLGQFLAHRFAEHLGVVRAAEAAVRIDRGPEFLHVLRVRLRRLRVLAAAFPVMAEDDHRFVREFLSSWSRALGDLRDWDVMLAEFPQLAEVAPPPLQREAAALLSWCTDTRTRAHATVLHTLRSSEHLQGRMRLDQMLAAGTFPGEAAAIAATTAAAQRLRKTARALRRSLRELPDQPEMAALHQLRLDIKRLRYLAEECADLGIAGEPRVVDRLLRAQERLGRVCDHELASGRYLTLLAASPPPPLALAALAGALAGMHSQQAVHHRQRGLRAARRLDRRWLWRHFKHDPDAVD